MPTGVDAPNNLLSITVCVFIADKNHKTRVYYLAGLTQGIFLHILVDMVDKQLRKKRN